MLDDAGRRDKLVTIQARPADDVVDDGGHTTEDFTDLLPRVWMSKKDVSGAELFRANQEASGIETEWQMPYRANMDPDAIDVPKLRRLVYLGRTYDITRAVLMETNEGKGIQLFTSAASTI